MATAVLAKAARMRPGSVPNNIDANVIRDWAEAIAMMSRPKITDLWKEAVTRWSLDEPNDRMFTPYSLRLAVDDTLDRWHHDSTRNDELQWYQYRHVCDRVERGELPPGTEEGFVPDSLERERAANQKLASNDDIRELRARVKGLSDKMSIGQVLNE